jgi:putative Mg2+ transporter-C (MgtC) family protein
MIDQLDTLRHLTMVSIALRFFLACLFGGIIGLERGRRQQAAGLRTHMMVCIGAASTMIVSEYMVLLYSANGDILRVSAQVVSGIGFLGAGTIMVTKQNQIRGLTTAASLWASACMGLVIGSGFYECALIMMLIMLFVLLILSGFDIKYVKVTANICLFLEIYPDCQFSIILQEIKDQGWNVQEIRELSFLNSEFKSIRIDLISDDQIRRPIIILYELRKYDKIHYVQQL